MRITITSKLSIFLGAAILVSLIAVASMSYLLNLATGATTSLAHSSKTSSRETLGLVTLLAKVQGLSLQLLDSQDPEVLESLLDQGKAAMADARQRAAGNQELIRGLDLLGEANRRFVDKILLGKRAAANLIFIGESNPAFEQLLEGIAHQQEADIQRLEQQTAAAAVSLHDIKLWVWSLVGLTILALSGVGLGLVLNLRMRLLRAVDRVRDMAAGEGDLTKRLPIQAEDELGNLARWLNAFLDKLQTLIVQVATTSGRLAVAGAQIETMAGHQAHNADSQRDQTHQVATAMEEMAATVREVTHNSHQAATASAEAAATASQGGQVVEEALTQMQSIAEAVGTAGQRIHTLGQNSHRVGEIVRVIGDIASQTNLLALNAAIEAARAGDQGRGFAVVADEVRKLAARTTQATREIGEMIAVIQGETHHAVQAMESGTTLVEAGVASTRQAGAALDQIIRTSGQVGEMITQIATAAVEQSAATEEVTHNLERISQDAADTAVSADQTARAVAELSSITRDLQKLTCQFRLDCRDR